LYSAGVGATYLNFLEAYLRPRRAAVVVEGEQSDEFEIADSVFQGTVLGPPLWNVFFQDVVTPAASTGGKPSQFADDLLVFKEFDRGEESSNILSDMERCRSQVHHWGKVNRVEFDPSKEHLVTIHPIAGEGDPFRYLGPLIDCKLQMHQAVDQILAQVRPKVKAILRTRSHYSTQALIDQFKTHVWSLMECHNGAIFHAATYILDKLDGVHAHFVSELGMTCEQAFLQHNLAPPCLRRDIGILGMLHKRVLGLSHPIFAELLPFHFDRFGSYRRGEHNRQLYGHIMEIQFQHALHFRSPFAMVYVYNRLPQAIVDCDTISAFQCNLTAMAKSSCQNGDANWARSFSCRM